MPRKPVSPRWRRRISALAADGYSPLSIERRLENEHVEDGEPRPSRRSIDRILADWRKLSVEEQRQYASFQWPETMMLGVLPWTAGADALDLLRDRDERGLPRPLVREVRWFWRLRQTAPSIPSRVADEVAMFLSSREVAEETGQSSGRTMPWLDLALAYRPWESESAAAAYQHMAERRGFPNPWTAHYATVGAGDGAFEIAYNEGAFGRETAERFAQQTAELQEELWRRPLPADDERDVVTILQGGSTHPLDEDDAE